MKVGFPGEGRWDRMLGDLHPMTLSSIASLGLGLGRAGDPAAAEPYCREAMEGYRRVLGDDHPDTLVSMGTLGAVLADLRRFAEAEPLAVKGCRRRVAGARTGRPSHCADGAGGHHALRQLA